MPRPYQNPQRAPSSLAGFGVDPLTLSRMRSIIQFARVADVRQRHRRVARFGHLDLMVMALDSVARADDLLSAALLADDGLFDHVRGDLCALTRHDADLAAACAWRLRAHMATPLFELHMASSTRLRALHALLQQTIDRLEGAPDEGPIPFEPPRSPG